MKLLLSTAFFVFGLLLFTQGASAQTADAKAKTLTWNEQKHDYGKLPQNVPATTTFTFTNNGKAPVVLSNVQGSCGCTTPEWTKEPVKPGKTGYVKATYNAAAVGPFSKTVTVTTNNGESHVLTIAGEVLAKDANAAQ